MVQSSQYIFITLIMGIENKTGVEGQPAEADSQRRGIAYKIMSRPKLVRALHAIGLTDLANEEVDQLCRLLEEG